MLPLVTPGVTGSHWPPTRLRATDHHAVGSAVQPTVTQPMLHHLLWEDLTHTQALEVSPFQPYFADFAILLSHHSRPFAHHPCPSLRPWMLVALFLLSLLVGLRHFRKKPSHSTAKGLNKTGRLETDSQRPRDLVFNEATNSWISLFNCAYTKGESC